MDILKILGMERDLLFEMLNTLMAEKEVLIKDNVAELQKITAQKDILKKQIDSIEKIRFEKFGSRKLDGILQSLEGDERTEAEKLGKDMENMILGIQEANSTNRMLIKQSLNYIRTIMNIISPAGITVYNPAGQIQGGLTTRSTLNTSV